MRNGRLVGEVGRHLSGGADMGGWVAGGKCDVGFDHKAAKGVSAGRGSGLVLVRLTVGFLLPDCI